MASATPRPLPSSPPAWSLGERVWVHDDRLDVGWLPAVVSGVAPAATESPTHGAGGTAAHSAPPSRFVTEVLADLPNGDQVTLRPTEADEKAYADQASKPTWAQPLHASKADKDGTEGHSRNTLSLLPRTHGVDENADEGGSIGWANMDTMRDLHAAAVLHNLRRRYAAGIIYTATGPILIALNPFTPLAIYGDEMIKAYMGSDTAQLPPHCFGTAHSAYEGLRSTGKHQALVICGESGAGKTETTKLMLKYLASVGRPGSMSSMSSTGFETSSQSGVEEAIMQSNPLMEALGNAQTTRNANSSRFGKFIKVFFSHGSSASPSVVGAAIVPYLLEKIRVTHVVPRERNYHIFYQILAPGGGLSPSARRASGLREMDTVDSFLYLSKGGSPYLDGVDDGEEFQATLAAFDSVGVSSAHRDILFRLLVGILHLGNVVFSSDLDGNACADDAVRAGGALTLASACLGVQTATLETALTTRRIAGPGMQDIFSPLSPQQAEDSRDALAREVYNRVFHWLVDQINVKLSPRTGTSKAGVIGILDIYGFECMEENGFQQLFINYTNEKLQGAFNLHVFAMEAAEYEREGIRIHDTHSVFVSNKPCLDLLEKPPLGVFSLMDEESRLATGKESAFLSKLTKAQSDHPRFKPPSRFERDVFTIIHYAGPVSYSTTGFVASNRDTLLSLLSDAMSASSVGVLSSLFTPTASSGPRQKLLVTVCTRFRQQMTDLMELIGTMRPWWVRCIKPNPKCLAFGFHGKSVLQQLHYGGVLEALRVRAEGYPNRFPYITFLRRYGMFLDWDSYVMLMRTADSELLRMGGKDSLRSRWGPFVTEIMSHPDVAARVGDDSYRLGMTQVFLRSNVLYALDATAQEIRSAAACVIQGVFRGYLSRRWFLKAKQSAHTIQRIARGMLGRNKLRHFLYQQNRKRQRRRLVSQLQADEKQRGEACAALNTHLQDAHAVINQVYNEVDVVGDPLVFPPVWVSLEEAEWHARNGSTVLRSDAGAFVLSSGPGHGIPASGMHEATSLHSAALQQLTQALTRLHELEIMQDAVNSEIADTLAATELDIDPSSAAQVDANTEARLSSLSGQASRAIDEIRVAVDAALSACEDAFRGTQKVAADAAAVAARVAREELQAMREEEDRIRWVLDEQQRVKAAALEAELREREENAAAMLREETQRREFLALVASVMEAAAIKARSIAREQQARDLVLMRREDELSRRVEEVQRAHLAILREQRRRHAAWMVYRRRRSAFYSLADWAAEVKLQSLERSLMLLEEEVSARFKVLDYQKAMEEKRELYERVAMSTEDVIVASVRLDDQIYDYSERLRENARQVWLEKVEQDQAALQALRLAAETINRSMLSGSERSPDARDVGVCSDGSTPSALASVVGTLSPLKSRTSSGAGYAFSFPGNETPDSATNMTAPGQSLGGAGAGAGGRAGGIGGGSAERVAEGTSLLRRRPDEGSWRLERDRQRLQPSLETVTPHLHGSFSKGRSIDLADTPTSTTTSHAPLSGVKASPTGSEPSPSYRVGAHELQSTSAVLFSSALEPVQWPSPLPQRAFGHPVSHHSPTFGFSDHHVPQPGSVPLSPARPDSRRLEICELEPRHLTPAHGVLDEGVAPGALSTAQYSSRHEVAAGDGNGVAAQAPGPSGESPQIGPPAIPLENLPVVGPSRQPAPGSRVMGSQVLPRSPVITPAASDVPAPPPVQGQTHASLHEPEPARSAALMFPEGDPLRDRLLLLEKEEAEIEAWLLEHRKAHRRLRRDIVPPKAPLSPPNLDSSVTFEDGASTPRPWAPPVPDRWRAASPTSVGQYPRWTASARVAPEDCHTAVVRAVQTQERVAHELRRREEEMWAMRLRAASPDRPSAASPDPYLGQASARRRTVPPAISALPSTVGHRGEPASFRSSRDTPRVSGDGRKPGPSRLGMVSGNQGFEALPRGLQGARSEDPREGRALSRASSVSPTGAGSGATVSVSAALDERSVAAKRSALATAIRDATRLDDRGGESIGRVLDRWRT